jgi:hypothetical protein
MQYESKLAVQNFESMLIFFFAEFTEESSPQNNSDLRQYFSRNVCSCKPVPICVCKSNTLHPFLQIRWKRLVIYEDLLSIVPQELSTTLMSCVKNICVERRWIVTGNPTTVGVSGLSLGSRVEPEQLRYMTASNGPSGARNASTSRQPNGKWVNDNEKTLIKFENMILNFICVPPPHYPLTKNVMEDNVVKPFLNDKGPELGSVQVLGQILEMIIIRQV